MPYPREDLQIAQSYPAENKIAETTTKPPQENHRVLIATIIMSYSATPTGGLLKLTDGTITIEHDIAGSGIIELSPKVTFTPGKEVTISLAAGGSAVKGKLTVLYTEE